MVINKFKMRSDIDSYNLAGMGCSAGVLAVGLATKLLRVCAAEFGLVETRHPRQGMSSASYRKPST